MRGLFCLKNGDDYFTGPFHNAFQVEDILGQEVTSSCIRSCDTTLTKRLDYYSACAKCKRVAILVKRFLAHRK